ncbi:MAG TPA: hydrogenase maturation nickel metallochaperone HypA [Anaerolineaceae bacterium]|nr:hydrogenase maturation nickel metallochaperone HypA [Anaerolineaceae bacterium]HPN51702.1 hydrogenase maturation nickel metallochaperone HypA [Anaerolineaceae bacterium]
MHELGIMFNVVRSVEQFARVNGVTQIDTLVLQIGELSPVVPHFIEACYPAAVDGTLLEKTHLKIEIIPGNVRCRLCGEVFNLPRQGKQCPKCAGSQWEVLSGKEFLIKEIVAC